MKKLLLLSVFTLSATVIQGQNKAYIASTATSHTQVHSLAMDEVYWTTGFWKERFDLVIPQIIPAQYTYFMDFSERNIDLAAKGNHDFKEGYKGTNWQDGDYCKFIEAQLSVYSISQDPALLKHIQEKAKALADAVADDGYFTTHTVIGYGTTGAGGKWGRPFKSLGRFADGRLHETYNMGHFLTLATTHYRITGTRILLDAAIKVGDFLDKYFQKVSPAISASDYNQTHLMGLMELYRTTGEERYLACVSRIIEGRGNKGGKTQYQDDRKIRQESRAVGHAVLGPVMYSGVADYVAETNDQELKRALERIWTDMYTRKASITGGLGNMHDGASETKANRNEVTHESFGHPYRLHSATAYNETCATFYGAYFSYRMFLLTGESKYLDTMERAFYNNLSSMALDGKSYFYTNVLRWYGKDHPLLSQDRAQRWTDDLPCVCCPTSLVRFLAQTKEYAYAKDEQSLYVILYGSNQIKTELKGEQVSFEQNTAYPNQGEITLNYEGKHNHAFDLKLRIPGWAKGATLSVNGKEQPCTQGSFATLSRTWQKGDVIALHLPLEPTLYEGNPKVEEVRNQVAVAVGPMIYCVEQPDLPQDLKLDDIILPIDAEFTVNYEANTLGGVNTLTTQALVRKSSFDTQELYAPISKKYDRFTLKLIPYYAWSNRGNHEMSVFLPVKW